MKRIGITGSLASGKSSAGKILGKKGPVFSADNVVKKLYSQKRFKKYLSKKLKIANSTNLKSLIKKKILKDKSEMTNFIKKHKNKKFTFFEIPLLVESRLMKKFDLILFIKAKRSLRMKRFKQKGGNKVFFNILNAKQLSDKNKAKHCDYVVVNEKNLDILKKNLLDILERYE